MKRLIEYLITIWIIITINFLLPKLIPGDPLLYLTGEASGDASIHIDEITREKLKQYYGLDQPVFQQYLHYLKGIFTLDFGYSIHYRTNVSKLILQTLPWTVFLIFAAIFISLFIGIFLGVLSAWKKDKLADKGLLMVIMGTSAIPPFLLALVFQIIFSIKLDIFPVSGGLTSFKENLSLIEKSADIFWHSALPIAVLTIVLIPDNYLLIRNTIIKVLSEDYIFVAKMKGLPKHIIMFRHALRNALLPILTHASLRLGLAVGGMIFVEIVFSYPGMGNLMYQSVLTHDYPLTQGIFFVITITVITINFLLDLVYRFIDPRIKN